MVQGSPSEHGAGLRRGGARLRPDGARRQVRPAAIKQHQHVRLRCILVAMRAHCVFVCCGFACCKCFLLALVVRGAELLSANHARSSSQQIQAAVDAVLKGTPNRPLYWVGVSNGGVPAAACAELYGGAGLMLLSAMPALGQPPPPASCPVLAAVGEYEHFWGGADRLSAGICRCMLDSTCHMLFVADIQRGSCGMQLYVSY